MATRPFFVPQKEINLINKMNEELIDEVVGQSVDIYKISIDNTEVSQLKLLCDQIFNAKNFIDIIIIESNPRGSQAAKHLANVHEYILVYARSETQLQIDGFQKEESKIDNDYPYTDENDQKFRLLGLRQRGGEWKREQRKNMFYPFFVNPLDSTVSLKLTKSHTKKTQTNKQKAQRQ